MQNEFAAYLFIVQFVLVMSKGDEHPFGWFYVFNKREFFGNMAAVPLRF